MKNKRKEFIYEDVYTDVSASTKPVLHRSTVEELLSLFLTHTQRKGKKEEKGTSDKKDGELFIPRRI